MTFKSVMRPFTARPRSSVALSVLLLVYGVVAVSGSIPVSPHRSYFPGHLWVLALLAWALAVFFGCCAYQGREQGSSSDKG